MAQSEHSMTTWCAHCAELRIFQFDHQIKMKDGRDTGYDLYLCDVCRLGASARPRPVVDFLAVNMEKPK